jgi:hypothetical protein
LPGDQATTDPIPGCSAEAGGDDGVMLPYAYEVTKYDPADRDDKGRYTGTQNQVSDHGPVEAAYLQAVADFAAETGVRQLAIREPQVAAFVHLGLFPERIDASPYEFAPDELDIQRPAGTCRGVTSTRSSARSLRTRA